MASQKLHYFQATNQNQFHMMKTIFSSFLILAAVSTTLAQAPDVSHPANFLILVETTDDGVKFSGEAGCAFTQLTFTLRPGRKQAVNQYGMTSIEEHKDPMDDKLANFLFTVKRTKDGLEFEGLKGTAWQELTFSCSDTGCKQLIDGSGMTNGW
jgi:hypothetical protein